MKSITQRKIVQIFGRPVYIKKMKNKSLISKQIVQKLGE